MDYNAQGKVTDLSTSCVPKGGTCPCGKNTKSCIDQQDATAKLCMPKFATDSTDCPAPCSPTAEKLGNVTCVQNNLDSKGDPTGESVSCVKSGTCKPGRGQKTCPDGSAISTAYSCKDLYGVVAKEKTGGTAGGTRRLKAKYQWRRRLAANVVTDGKRQTASVRFTLENLVSGITGKDTPKVKVKLDSILQLQPTLQSELTMVKSGTEASMMYKITNLGSSKVAPSQVAEKLRGYLNSGTTSTKTALATLGTVKLGTSGCCTLSTDVKTVVDKAPTDLKNEVAAEEAAKKSALVGAAGTTWPSVLFIMLTCISMS